jgi:hypothetical protein
MAFEMKTWPIWDFESTKVSQKSLVEGFGTMDVLLPTLDTVGKGAPFPYFVILNI